MSACPAGNLDLVGNRLCLDFTNTVSTHVEGAGREYLRDYADLIAWCRHVELLEPRQAESLLMVASQRPDQAAETLARALAFRELIYRIFSALAAGGEPAAADLNALNTAVREVYGQLQVISNEDDFELTWPIEPYELDQTLRPIVRSAAELLTSSERNRVRKCAGENCDWLFLDLSKNRSRRWCSMGVCGSRMKARRYYRRQKQHQIKE